MSGILFQFRSVEVRVFACGRFGESFSEEDMVLTIDGNGTPETALTRTRHPAKLAFMNPRSIPNLWWWPG